MDLLISTSLIAAYIAGFAALFAPCCITILLPTYFASIFKQKHTVFLMTFIYFLGLLVVFIPIGLGVGAFTMLFRQYHNAIFFGGGTLLLFLGSTLLLGKQFSLPMIIHPQLTTYDTFSIFILGIFSAVATTCCAPVLAGVLALSALPGSYLWGIMYTLTYVLGIVTPLFILAAVLDKTKVTQKFLTLRKPSNFVSGLMYSVIGIIILYLTITNRLTMQNTYQLSVTIYIAQLTKFIGTYTRIIPEPVWAVMFVIIIGTIMAKAIRWCIESTKHTKGGEKYEIHRETHHHNGH